MSGGWWYFPVARSRSWWRRTRSPLQRFQDSRIQFSSIRGNCKILPWGLSACNNLKTLFVNLFTVSKLKKKQKTTQSLQIYCNSNAPGRGSSQSYGRKRRQTKNFALNNPAWLSLSSTSTSSSPPKPIEENEEELVMEMLRVGLTWCNLLKWPSWLGGLQLQVYARRDEIPETDVTIEQQLEICLSRVEYYSLITSLVIILIIMVVAAFVAGLLFRLISLSSFLSNVILIGGRLPIVRRYRLLHFKNTGADSTAPHSMMHSLYGHRSHAGHPLRHSPSARNFTFINRAFETR